MSVEAGPARSKRVSSSGSLLVHLPNGSVLVAGAAELIVIHTGRPAWRTIAVAKVRAAAAMGAITVIAGWAPASAPFVKPTPIADVAQVDRDYRRCDRRGADL